MREKLYTVLKKTYGALLFLAFFAGLLPVIPFVIALIIGGSLAENISLFLYKQYYPWVIATAAISVVIGWIAMYLAKKEKGSDGQKDG